MRHLASWTTLLALVSSPMSAVPVASAEADRQGDRDETGARTFAAVVGAETRDESIQALYYCALHRDLGMVGTIIVN